MPVALTWGPAPLPPASDRASPLPAIRFAVAAVVDDGSRDRRFELAWAAGATVLPAGDPPPGWTAGRGPAAVGAAATSSELLPSLDADVVSEPGGARRPARGARRPPGLGSVQPVHTAERPYR